MKTVQTRIMATILASLVVLLASLVVGLEFGLVATAQDGPEIEWSQIFGGDGVENVQSVAQTSDGGYVFVGLTMSYGFGYTDVWLVKTDAEGNQMWEKNFGTSKYDDGSSVQQTADGGYIVVGYCDMAGGGYKDSKLCLIKTDADGNLQWEKIFDTVYYEGSFVPVSWSEGASVRQTTDGGYIVAGACQPSGGSYAIWLIKTDADGNRLWDPEHNMWVVGWELLLTNDWSLAEGSVRGTLDGGYIVVAPKYDSYYAAKDIWLIKTDGSGVVEWDKTFGKEYVDPVSGETYAGSETPHSVQQTTDGGYVITGTSYGHSDLRGWVIKTDALGDKIWERVLEPWTYSSAAQQTADGGYVILGSCHDCVGSSTDCIWLAKTDSEGNQLWEERTDGCWWVCGTADGVQTNDGGYVVVANIKQGFGAKGDAWLVKLQAPDDNDRDGFDDAVELYLTTDPLDACPDVVGSPGLCPGPSCDGDDCWPADLDVDRDADIVDVVKFKLYIMTSVPPSPQRFDFDADGDIDIVDVLKYKPLIMMSCANP